MESTESGKWQEGSIQESDSGYAKYTVRKVQRKIEVCKESEQRKAENVKNFRRILKVVESYFGSYWTK